MGDVKDITGNGVDIGFRFGAFTVIGKKQTKSHIMWDCLCDCGRHRYYGGEMILSAKRREDWLKPSCGFCQTSPPVQEYKIRRRIYHNWNGIKQRCFNPNCKVYKDYGGRGIKICDEWANNFKVFFDYVSGLEHFNEPGRSIDRINNDGDYCPGNVRWATAKEQANNTRRSKRGLDNGNGSTKKGNPQI